MKKKEGRVDHISIEKKGRYLIDFRNNLDANVSDYLIWFPSNKYPTFEFSKEEFEQFIKDCHEILERK